MKANDLDFNRVALFVAIVEARGITAAAARLKLPKSSVSRALSQLERELGAELVARTTSPRRPFELTEAGRALYESTAGAVSALNNARDSVRGDARAPRGVIRIAAPPTMAAWLVVPFVARFLRDYPAVEVHVTATTRSNLSPMRDGFDIVLTSGKLEDSSAKARSLGTVDLGVFASADYVREHGAPRRPQDLAQHDCILQSEVALKPTWRLRSAAGVVTDVAVAGHLRVDDMFIATAAAASGAGLVVLPAHAGATDPFAKNLVRVLPDYVIEGDAAHLLYAPSHHLPLRIRLFVDQFVENGTQRCNGHHTAPATTRMVGAPPKGSLHAAEVS